jgi:hypothetical protein
MSDPRTFDRGSLAARWDAMGGEACDFDEEQVRQLLIALESEAAAVDGKCPQPPVILIG